MNLEVRLQAHVATVQETDLNSVDSENLYANLSFCFVMFAFRSSALITNLLLQALKHPPSALVSC